MADTFATWNDTGIDTDDVIEIPLTQGFTAIIDAADSAVAEPYKFQAHIVRRSKTVYAARPTTPEEQAAGWPRRALLHRLVMGDPNGPGIDHINGNGLDCRRCNLRYCDQSTNNRNVDSRSASGRVGVGFDRSRGRWRAYAKFNGKSVTIGRFDTKAEAIEARTAFERQHFTGIVFRWSDRHGN